MTYWELVAFGENMIMEYGRLVIDKTKEWLKGAWEHAEAISLLTLAGIGVSALLGEIPFWFMLPFWIDAAVIIPAISAVLVLSVLKTMEFRVNRRTAHAAYLA